MGESVAVSSDEMQNKSDGGAYLVHLSCQRAPQHRSRMRGGHRTPTHTDVVFGDAVRTLRLFSFFPSLCFSFSPLLFFSCLCHCVVVLEHRWTLRRPVVSWVEVDVVVVT